MKVYKYILLSVVCFIASAATLSAQQRISGQISDAMGPLMMVNVVEIDKDNRIVEHSTTDFDGNFTMIVKNTKNKLKISYVGFKDEVLEIGTRTVFNITMKDDNQIEEVIIEAKPRTNSGRGVYCTMQAIFPMTKCRKNHSFREYGIPIVYSPQNTLHLFPVSQHSLNAYSLLQNIHPA